MPIVNTVRGDLLKMFVVGEVEVLVHGANCQKCMGGGIAGQIARHPTLHIMARVDEADYRTPERRLGDFTLSKFNSLDRTVKGNAPLGINLYTQLAPARSSAEVAVDYWALGFGFTKLNRFLKGNGYKTVGIPKIGAGLANGDWAVIERIINDTTPDLDIILVEFQP